MKATQYDNVVYILGAGFSANFGLPVMSNFLEKAKDILVLKDINPQWTKDIDTDNIASVFNNMDVLRRCKDHYASDFLNIEEILSLLDMGRMMGAKNKQSLDFRRFISDVIKFYTPRTNNQIKEYDAYSPLLLFLKRIFRLAYEQNGFSYETRNDVPHYSILTFNYDNIFEKALEKFNYIESRYEKLSFSTEYIQNSKNVPLIKIHGTVDKPESIIAPTWRKDFSSSQTGKDVWKTAGDILIQANHIRIIGYSLPETDSYLKYFLKWGAAHEQNLKSIDVICLDDDKNSVENRYRKFIISPKLSFFNRSTKDYLEFIEKTDTLETAHEKLFNKSSPRGVQNIIDLDKP